MYIVWPSNQLLTQNITTGIKSLLQTSLLWTTNQFSQLPLLLPIELISICYSCTQSTYIWREKKIDLSIASVIINFAFFFFFLDLNTFQLLPKWPKSQSLIQFTSTWPFLLSTLLQYILHYKCMFVCLCEILCFELISFSLTWKCESTSLTWYIVEN